MFGGGRRTRGIVVVQPVAHLFCDSLTGMMNHRFGYDPNGYSAFYSYITYFSLNAEYEKRWDENGYICDETQVDGAVDTVIWSLVQLVIPVFQKYASLTSLRALCERDVAGDFEPRIEVLDSDKKLAAIDALNVS